MKSNVVVSIIGALFFSLLLVILGMAIPMLGPKYSLLLGVLIASPLIIMIPSELLIALAVAFCFVIVGAVGYFVKVDLYWIPYLLGLASYVIAVVNMSTQRSQQMGSPRRADSAKTWMVWSVALFAACLLASSVMNIVGPYHALVALRDYAFLWGVFLIIAFTNLHKRIFQRIWVVLLCIAIVQIPVSIYQYLFVAAKRSDGTALDAVVGTFTGTQDGGGDSGGMLVFLLAMLIVAYELWRRKAVGGVQVFAVLVSFLCFAALAEVKVVFILVPCVVIWFVLLAKNQTILSRLMILVVAGSVVGSGGWVYATFKQGPGQNTSIAKLIEKSSELAVGTDAVDYRIGTVGRVASVVLWHKDHARTGDVFSFVLGNGIGATKISREGIGGVAKRFYPISVDATAAAVLLWDAGLIGFLAYMSFMVGGVVFCFRLSRREGLDAWQAGFCSAASLIVFLCILMMFYSKNVVATSPGTQLLLILCLAFPFRWSRLLEKGGSNA